MCLTPAILHVQLVSVMAMRILSVLQTTTLRTSMLYTEGVNIDVSKSDIQYLFVYWFVAKSDIQYLFVYWFVAKSAIQYLFVYWFNIHYPEIKNQKGSAGSKSIIGNIPIYR